MLRRFRLFIIRPASNSFLFSFGVILFKIRNTLFYEPFGLPLPRSPATHEDDASDVLVEGEAYPHAYKTIAEGNANDITQADGNAPLEDDADDDRIDGIARSTQCSHGEDIGCATHLKENIDDKYPDAHGNYFRIVGKGTEDAPTCQREKDGAGDGDDHRPAEEVVAKNISRLMAPLTYEVSNENVAALCDADAEQIDKHDHVVTVRPCRQRLVANLVDEEGDDHLRETVRDVLAHGRDADMQQILQFLPRCRSEVVQWEPWDMNLEMDDCEKQCRNCPAGGCSDSGTLNTELWTAPVTEDESVVA